MFCIVLLVRHEHTSEDSSDHLFWNSGSLKKCSDGGEGGISLWWMLVVISVHLSTTTGMVVKYQPSFFSFFFLLHPDGIAMLSFSRTHPGVPLSQAITIQVPCLKSLIIGLLIFTVALIFMKLVHQLVVYLMRTKAYFSFEHNNHVCKLNNQTSLEHNNCISFVFGLLSVKHKIKSLTESGILVDFCGTHFVY